MNAFIFLSVTIICSFFITQQALNPLFFIFSFNSKTEKIEHTSMHAQVVFAGGKGKL